MAAKPYYITTPIYYPSGNPHIGHCYTTVACDSIARYRRMQGYDVMFLTGTDEHGLKIEQKAAEKGVTPKEYVDEIVKTFKSLWSYMNISYDRYIRTTDDYHIETVQKIFKELYDKGYIYKGKYQGKYCTPCESFWTESQLVDGKCPECGRPVIEAEEEAYFFKMSPFADRITHLLTETDYLQPKTRATELVNNFIKPGLEDLCVSRTSSTRSTSSMFGLTLCQTISLHWASIMMLTMTTTATGRQMCIWLQRILCDSMQSSGLRS